MSPSNPEWYEELREHPLRTVAFTERLAWRIRENAESGGGRRRRGGMRYATYCAALLGVAAILLFAFLRDENSPVTPPVVPSNAPAVVPTAPLPEDLPLLKESIERIASKPEPTDEEWRRLMVEKSAIKNKELIGKVLIGNQFMMLMWKNGEEKNGILALNLGIDQFYWEESKGIGWEPSGGIAYSLLKQNGVITKLDSYSSKFRPVTGFTVLDGTLNHEIGKKRIPYSFGMVIDPGIVRIKAIDTGSDTGSDKPIELNMFSKDGETYWFGLLPADSHEYKLEGIDSDGNVIASESRFYYY
ncbi:hypothetical protein [Cohnella thailandensis]|uniref:Uncharacterized protein n=1 Tax=Cohnella thailandensis TaxID=557557 RepID=A0A841SPC3_9BACL|nr:hypothetical protein [Cohnella thailandensis]MBB6633042.1 hypothetical protein [Cohnella thailandensis]MBP1975263.1 hypothetical protein [Cohnella thailandensis]